MKKIIYKKKKTQKLRFCNFLIISYHRNIKNSIFIWKYEIHSKKNKKLKRFRRLPKSMEFPNLVSVDGGRPWRHDYSHL